MVVMKRWMCVECDFVYRIKRPWNFRLPYLMRKSLYSPDTMVWVEGKPWMWCSQCRKLRKRHEVVDAEPWNVCRACCVERERQYVSVAQYLVEKGIGL
jgi:hypothetical protein